MRGCITLLALALLLAGCNLVQSGEITPIPTPDLPRAEILDPVNNRQIVEGTTFDIDIVARDENPGIARVELLVDGEKINESAPVDSEFVPVFRVTMNWRAEGTGMHLLEALPFRPDGTQGDSAVITIEVIPRP